MTENISKIEILDTIRQLTKELGYPPSQDEFQDLTRISRKQVLLHFQSWREALRLSGVELNSTNIKLDDKDLLEDWGFFVRKNRHIPTQKHYSQKGKYGYKAFYAHFGTWSVIPIKFKEYAKDKPEWDDVLSLLPSNDPKPINNKKPKKIVQPERITRRHDLSLGYVDPKRLTQLRGITNDKFDLAKLIRFCEELNESWKDESFLAVTMLVRAILDHVPPIFGCEKFPQIAGNHGGKSFKESMLHLENSSRKIADRHLHSHIRQKENLPVATQVNFANDLDVLLEEIVTILK
ncbi:MAG: hypothetical protein JNK81_04090 [Anaerolineales bacterium]|nr:hypothetical protein [Anaerolineales bacterium]